MACLEERARKGRGLAVSAKRRKEKKEGGAPKARRRFSLVCRATSPFMPAKARPFGGFLLSSRRRHKELMMTRAGRGEEKQPRGTSGGGAFFIFCPLHLDVDHRRPSAAKEASPSPRRSLFFSHLDTLEESRERELRTDPRAFQGGDPPL